MQITDTFKEKGPLGKLQKKKYFWKKKLWVFFPLTASWILAILQTVGLPVVCMYFSKKKILHAIRYKQPIQDLSEEKTSWLQKGSLHIKNKSSATWCQRDISTKNSYEMPRQRNESRSLRSQLGYEKTLAFALSDA